MDKKTTIEVTERCAWVINGMNDETNDVRSTLIESIADTFSSLADMLMQGRDEEALAVHADQIVRAMSCVSDYYRLVTDITFDSFNENRKYVLLDERERSNEKD